MSQGREIHKHTALLSGQGSLTLPSSQRQQSRSCLVKHEQVNKSLLKRAETLLSSPPDMPILFDKYLFVKTGGGLCLLPTAFLTPGRKKASLILKFLLG